jgi:penicillin V acylase-like amidase (Ntn superfamily)
MIKIFLALIICICFLPIKASSCTTLVLDKNCRRICGKNADWRYMPAYVFVNKRGVAKTTIPKGTDPVISWTSKYGSVTFNFDPREMPFEGINEAGLFVSGMGQYGGELPDPDSRLPVNMFTWIQYQLDNFTTVDEALGSFNFMSIPKGKPGAKGGFHFLVSDSLGNCAAIEFIDGTLVYHTGETMPVKVFANASYDQSMEVLISGCLFPGIPTQT